MTNHIDKEKIFNEGYFKKMKLKKRLYNKRYLQKIGVKAKIKEYKKNYDQRPEVIAKRKEYEKLYKQKPEIKEKIKLYQKIYNQRPEVIAKRKLYYNKPEVKLRIKTYYNTLKWKDWARAYEKSYYQIPEKRKRIDEYHKLYYQKKKDFINKRRNIWLENNREMQNLHKRNRKKNDMDFAIRCKLGSRLRQVFKSVGHKKYKPSVMYGVNFDLIIESLRPFPKNISEYHIDHIVPLSSFDLTKKNQIKKAFAPNNHQWLLKKDNLLKGNKLNWNKPTRINNFKI